MDLAPILWNIHYRIVFYFANYNFYVQLSMELRKNTPRQKFFDALTNNGYRPSANERAMSHMKI